MYMQKKTCSECQGRFCKDGVRCRTAARGKNKKARSSAAFVYPRRPRLIIKATIAAASNPPGASFINVDIPVF